MEEHVSHISELENLNSELDGFLAELKGREEGHFVKIGDLKAQLDAARAQAEAASVRLSTQEATLSAALKEAKTSLIAEISKSADLLSERDALAAKLESVSRLLDEEKARSSEKDLFIKSSRSAIKDKEAESDKIWRAMEDLKAELASERAAVKEREDQIRKLQKEYESLELKSGQASRDAARSEEGFLLKIDLLKKELREQAAKADGLERSLAAASSRIDEALQEAALKERLLAEARGIIDEKEALLKSAGEKVRELVAEAESLRTTGRVRGGEELGREIAASMAARVQELEDALSRNSAESMDRFRKLQAELSDAKAALRKKDEENASLKGREDSLRREVQEAEEKWKLASAQLNNAASRLREADNDREISEGRIKTLEAECERLRAAAKKAEATASALAAQEGKVRDGEAASLISALEEQGAKYAELLKKYDDLVLAMEAGTMDKAVLKAEAEVLETRLRAMETEAAGAAAAERERFARLSERVQNADALLKKKELELDETRAALSALGKECDTLRRSRVSLGQKYAAEIAAEDEMVSQAQAKVIESDSLISKLLSEEKALREETDALKKEKQGFLDLIRKKSSKEAGKLSDDDRQLAEKEKRLAGLSAELAKIKAEKAELEDSESRLREELRAKPYRAMLREAEEKLLIKEKMLAEMGSRLSKLGGDFEELKKRGPAPGAPGYMPEFEELVAGVAHQIANSISIIRSHAEFCAESPEAEGVGDSLRIIVRNIVALQRKIDTIMNFSRPVIPQRSPERLSAIVSETLEAMRVAGKLERIEARVETAGEVPAIGVDRVRLAAAVEQLLVNAAEAMPGGGSLTVKVSASPGFQRVEVRDTGEGIEKKHLPAVFHPFFTTKPGKMGLGLTLARNIAKAHGGNLELFGEPGSGARAVLTLPEV